jgi:transketolase
MTAPKIQQDLDQLCINTIRTLSLDAIQKAESGHPGLPLGMAPTAYILWTRFMRYNPKNPKWFNRDRFLLSAGHGSMLIYAMLHLTGYDLSMDEIKNFRQLHSKTPGHPENFMTPGVEITTGPLGQGFANGVGMAMAEAHLAAKFNRKGFPIVNHHVYCICSDGDLMEGVAYESASLAGHLKLSSLIYFYDDNNITIEGDTDLAFNEDVTKRFEAANWHVLEVTDGNDLEAIENAIKEAHKITDKPKLIRVKTIIGFGMPKQGTSKAHSDAPGEEAVRETKRNLGWDENKHFFVPKEAGAHFREAIKRGAQYEKDWDALVKKYEKTHGDSGKALKETRLNKLPEGWEKSLPTFDNVEAKATRAYEEIDFSEEAFKERFKQTTRPKFLDKAKNKTLRDCKSRITIFIDADIIEHFKQLSEESGKGYQTLINQTLRETIETGKPSLSEVKDDLLKDKKFLKNLKNALAI